MNALVLAALTDGSFIFLAVVVGMFFALVFGYYTIKGSGINQHPTSGLRGQSPGARDSSHRSGMGRVSGDPNDSGPDGAGMAAGDTFSSRGTDSSRPSRRKRRRS